MLCVSCGECVTEKRCSNEEQQSSLANAERRRELHITPKQVNTVSGGFPNGGSRHVLLLGPAARVELAPLLRNPPSRGQRGIQKVLLRLCKS